LQYNIKKCSQSLPRASFPKPNINETYFGTFAELPKKYVNIDKAIPSTKPLTILLLVAGGLTSDSRKERPYSPKT